MLINIILNEWDDRYYICIECSLRYVVVIFQWQIIMQNDF